MSQKLWTAVDRYITELLVPSDPILDAVLLENAQGGLPPIDVSASQGKLLNLLVHIQHARNILEIGALGGYSTISLSRALPQGGRLVTLEANPKHAAVARKNIARAGLAEVVDIRLGRALDTLPQLLAEGRGPFDLIFVDADKASNVEYFNWALRLSRLGSVIIFDNVVRNGAVLDAASTDPNIQGVRQLHERLANDRA